MLERMLTNRVITPGGLEWLIAATDPFHDTEVSLTGYPDVSATRSLCQTVTKTFTVESPSLGGANWDCHIFFLPVTYSYGSFATDGSSNTSAYTTAVMNNAGVVVQGSVALGGSQLFGGVNVIGVQSGANWNDATADASVNVAFDSAFSSDMYRLIGCGFEVINTTAELYKGGSVTCYRTPSQITSMPIIDLTLAGTVTPTMCDFVVAPPFTQDIASLYPDSKTWGASDGVYSISTLNTTQNPYFNPGPHSAGIILPFNNGQLLASNATSNTDVWLPPTGSINHGNGIARSCSTALPWDINGCIFTGLATQTALTVTVKYYFERLPSPDNQQLLVLTRQPASYDPQVLEIYARCMAEVPVAVCVGENPVGEWFARVLNAIGTVAPIVGNAVGNAARGSRKVIGAVMHEINRDDPFNDVRMLPPVRIAPVPPPKRNTQNGGSGPPRKPNKPAHLRVVGPPPLPRRYTQAYQNLAAEVALANKHGAARNANRRRQGRAPNPPPKRRN